MQCNSMSNMGILQHEHDMWIQCQRTGTNIKFRYMPVLYVFVSDIYTAIITGSSKSFLVPLYLNTLNRGQRKLY